MEPYSTQKKKIFTIVVNESVIRILKTHDEDYICLTDMASSHSSERVVENWLRNKNSIEFLGIWESLNNAAFNSLEFERIKNVAGLNRFSISVKEWVQLTNAIGVLAKTGRYGGTFAHKDIAFEFGSWLSPEFKLLVIKEYQRLKNQENKMHVWDSRRYLSKINYRLQTDSIKQILLPALHLNVKHEIFVYTSEADMLNLIVFGQTATAWKAANPELTKQDYNQRDYASLEQLVILANLESLNSHLISQHVDRENRTRTLCQEAQRQFEALIKIESSKKKLSQRS